MHPTEEIKDIWCDFCYKKIKDKNDEFYSGGTIQFNFAYGSDKDDALGCFTPMDICDECFEKHFRKFYKVDRSLRTYDVVRGQKIKGCKNE